MTDESEDILSRVDNGVGYLTLNRPKAINSLNQSMVTRLACGADGSGSRIPRSAPWCSPAPASAACAPAATWWRSITAPARTAAEARRFWHDEYLMNAQIGRFPKTYVALMDGIVMGGGVGVGAHANTRVVTDTSKMAMPEVGIGFIPDVGGAYLLSRAPGSLGLHAALTGAPFSGADAIALGFADHFVPHDKLDALRQAIADDGVDAGDCRPRRRAARQ